jgi:hypothetical protein
LIGITVYTGLVILSGAVSQATIKDIIALRRSEGAPLETL